MESSVGLDSSLFNTLLLLVAFSPPSYPILNMDYSSDVWPPGVLWNCSTIVFLSSHIPGMLPVFFAKEHLLSPTLLGFISIHCSGCLLIPRHRYPTLCQPSCSLPTSPTPLLNDYIPPILHLISISVSQPLLSGAHQNRSTWWSFGKKIRLLAKYIWPRGNCPLQGLVIFCMMIMGLERAVNVFVPIYYKQIGKQRMDGCQGTWYCCF